MNLERWTRRDAFVASALAAGAVVTLSACDDTGGGGGNGNGNGGPYGGSQPDGTSPGGSGGQALARLSDIPVGDAVSASGPDGEEIIVARPEENAAAAFSATCTHQGCTVAPAETELKCPCHGSAYEKFTGQVRNGPAEEPLSEIAVRVENGQVVTAGG